MFNKYKDRFYIDNSVPRDLICTQEWSKENLQIVLELACEMKKNRFHQAWLSLMQQKCFLMLFAHPSIRTRISFDAAVTELGGHAIYMNPSMGWFPSAERKGESIEDIAQVVSGYVAGIGMRLGFYEYSYYGAGNEIIREYAKWASVPVINMADDKFHPCQGLADIMGWIEWFSQKSQQSFSFDAVKGKNILFTWAQGGQGGDKGSARPWNSIQEALLVASRFGLNITLARPDGYDLDLEVYQWVRENCQINGTSFKIINDPEEGYKNADIVYTRNWASSTAYQDGAFQKQKEMEKTALHPGWTTTTQKMAYTNNAIFTHPMPVDRGIEVVDEVASGTNSVIYNVAKNRLHVEKAILSLLTSN